MAKSKFERTIFIKDEQVDLSNILDSHFLIIKLIKLLFIREEIRPKHIIFYF